MEKISATPPLLAIAFVTLRASGSLSGSSPRALNVAIDGMSSASGSATSEPKKYRISSFGKGVRWETREGEVGEDVSRAIDETLCTGVQLGH